jgi:protein-S-isoprenylcysteine O-methyltransferase Ste14
MQSPGIRFWPPLYFLSGGAAAWGLHRQLDFEVDGAGVGPMQWWLGLALIVAGSALVVWAFIAFARARTTVRPDRAATALVMTGPYGFSRNPIYVADALIYVGVALLVNSAWALVLLPVVLALLARRVIRREEQYLHAEFGDEYEQFRRRVRRWL